MATNRDIVSRVRSTHKLLGDASITDRAILAELKSFATTLIKQQTDKRKLWSTSTIFTPISCLEMEEVPIAECCDYISDKTVARSKHKLPKIGEGNYGLLIQGVFAIELNKKINESTISRFINSLRLGLRRTDIYYWVYNDYIYISNPTVKTISISAYFEEDISEEILNPECECLSKSKKNKCINPLDLEFKCPGALESVVVNTVSRTLLESYFRIKNDQLSDAKDDQVNQR